MTARVLDMLEIDWATPARRQEFLAQLVADTLQDLDRIYAYEDQLTPINGESLTADESALEIIWGMFEDWTAEAETLRRRLESDRFDPVRTATLRQAIDRVRTRLSVSPKELLNAVANAGASNRISGEDLRRELRHRMAQ